MASNTSSHTPSRAVLVSSTAKSLGIEGLAPDDDDEGGLSLEELGRTYAAVISKGADPYQQEPIATEPHADSMDSEELPDIQELAENVSDAAPRRVVDADDDRGCEITPRSILEAILFVGHPGNEPLTSQQIAGLMRGVTAPEIDDLIKELNETYGEEGAVYEIRSVGAGYILTIREEFSPLREKFYGRLKEVRLTQQAIDVLAIVAYNQPITLLQIDRIRGRSSGAALSQLVRRDLLVCEPGQTKGEKPTYRTTERFLDLYGLDNLADLPQVD